METKITQDKKSCDSNNLVLLVEMKDRDDSNTGMTFNFRYRLRIKKGKHNKHKRVEGTIESLGVCSSNILDDEDAVNYSRDVERESVLDVEKYIRKKFGRLETNIETTYGTIFSLNINSRI